MVHTVHWLAAQDAAKVYGSIEIPPCPPLEMIPYEDLNPDIVMEWLLNSLGQEQLAQISSKIDEQLQPPNSSAGLPWDQESWVDNFCDH
jgi:hypothetical protein